MRDKTASRAFRAQKKLDPPREGLLSRVCLLAHHDRIHPHSVSAVPLLALIITVLLLVAFE